MIYGIGNDIENINQIYRLINKYGDRFINKFFTNDEKTFFKARNFDPKVIAGNFSVKESFVKALGTGFVNISPKNISVLRNAKGMPYIVYDENIKLDKNIYKTFATISHKDYYVMTTVIIEEV